MPKPRVVLLSDKTSDREPVSLGISNTLGGVVIDLPPMEGSETEDSIFLEVVGGCLWLHRGHGTDRSLSVKLGHLKPTEKVS